MSASRTHQTVRLGMHGGKSVFEQAAGLHEEVAGLTVVGEFDTDDPEVMFEEHGRDATCEYFEILVDKELDESIGATEVRPETRERVGSSDERVAWTAMRAAFLTEQPAFVNQMIRELKQALEPNGGAVALIQVSPRFQRRIAIIRTLHTAQAQPERSFAEILGGPYPLQHHASGVDIFPAYLYMPLVLMASPFSSGFVASRAILEVTRTLLLVVLINRRAGVPMKDADVTWLQVYDDALPDLRKTDGEGTTWLRQTNHHAADLDGPALIRWWTTQLNALFTEATDLGRFRGDDGQFDAGNAYRELRSLDRIISNCVRIQTHPSDHAIRVGLAFEFFDLLPNIIDRKVSVDHVWETLANPKTGSKTLNAAFARAPGEIGQMLRRRTDEVLLVLRRETLEHIMPGRRAKGKVSLGTRGRSPLQEDVFIAKLLHQLRNTHHGYELGQPSQRDLINIHTGHISQVFPELVVLYMIAILAQPDEALAGNWF
jgi:hypothetical protein